MAIAEVNSSDRTVEARGGLVYIKELFDCQVV
jgi:hypothetical protein